MKALRIPRRSFYSCKIRLMSSFPSMARCCLCVFARPMKSRQSSRAVPLSNSAHLKKPRMLFPRNCNTKARISCSRPSKICPPHRPPCLLTPFFLSRKDYLDEKSELYKDAPRTYKKRKFNAFFDNGKSQQQGDKKKSNDKKKPNKKDQPKFNKQLMTFDGAKDLDADAIKVSLMDTRVCHTQTDTMSVYIGNCWQGGCCIRYLFWRRCWLH